MGEPRKRLPDWIRDEVAQIARDCVREQGAELEKLAHQVSLANELSDPAALIAKKRSAVLGQAYRGAMDPFRQAILESSSPQDAMDRVRKAYAHWSPERLNSELESALQPCAAHGAVDALPK